MLFILDSSHTIYNLRIKSKYLEPYMKYDNFQGADCLALSFASQKLYVSSSKPGQLWEIDIYKKHSNDLSTKFSFMKHCQSMALTDDDRWLFCGDSHGNIVIFDMYNYSMHEPWERFLNCSVDNIFIMRGGKFYWIIASSIEKKSSRDSTLKLAFFKPNGSGKQIKDDMFERDGRIMAFSN